MQEYSRILKYYISKGAQEVTIPDIDGKTGIEAQQLLEDLGLEVEIQKEYSDLDEDGYILVDPDMRGLCFSRARSNSKIRR